MSAADSKEEESLRRFASQAETMRLTVEAPDEKPREWSKVESSQLEQVFPLYLQAGKFQVFICKADS